MRDCSNTEMMDRYNPLRLFVVSAISVAMAMIAIPALAASCTIPGTSTFNLGSYDPLRAGPVDINPAFTFTCTTASVPVTISASGGGNGNTRFMAGPRPATNAQLFYTLYNDAGHQSVWGSNGSHIRSVTSNSTANVATTVTVYAEIPAAVTAGTNDVPAGTYNDTITVTINF